MHDSDPQKSSLNLDKLPPLDRRSRLKRNHMTPRQSLLAALRDREAKASGPQSGTDDAGPATAD